MSDVEQIVRELIDKTFHMSLATVADNKPWVCEVHFAYDDNLNLYWSSLRASRHSQEIEHNTSVAGNIVRQHELGESPEGIYFEGAAKLLVIDKEKTQAFASMRQRLGLTEQDLEDTKDSSKHQFYKVTVKTWHIFGKFGEKPMQKYSLEWDGGNK